MKVVLLVTWMISGQPASSCQVTFDNWQKCNAAKEAILRDREQVRQQMGLLPLGEFVAVSAVCAAQ